MAHIILKRYSTNNQDAKQQTNTINRYLKLNDIVPSLVVEESEHGDVPFNKRALGRIIDHANKGDTIIVSEFSRLNRDVGDSFAMFQRIREKGIKLYAVVEKMELGGNDIDMGQYMNLFLRSMSAETELNNIRQRSKAKQDSIKEDIKENGFYISKAGRKITRLGNPRLEDYRDKAIEAAATAKRERSLRNTALRQSYEVAKRMRLEGKDNQTIANHLMECGFKTATGKEFKTASAVSYLIKRGNNLWGK